MYTMTPTTNNRTLHPQKLMMWMAMGSMFMVFAGLTSAFILQKSTANWVMFKLPTMFYISTLVIILSSVTMYRAKQAFYLKNRAAYKNFIILTVILGSTFIGCQLLGFRDLYSQKITLQGSTSNGFLYIISGLHIAHMAAAIVALIIIYFMALRKKVKVYSTVGIDIMSLFWHFVDGLWIYLFIFFCINFKL
jgi:cytochrome c oxidase subunit III